MDYKKKTFNPDKHCEMLSERDCEDPVLNKSCKYDPKKKRCAKNIYGELDKYIDTKGFDNFIKFDENKDIKEELYLRDKLCERLNAEPGGMCSSNLGQAYGCKVKKSFFGNRKCHLDEHIVHEYTKFNRLCIIENCMNRRRRGSNICTYHLEEFNEMMTILESSYNYLFYSKDIKNSKKYLDDFYDIHSFIEDIYMDYLLDKPEKIDKINQMLIDVETQFGDDICQAYNVESCKNDEPGNKNKKRCANRATESYEGKFCRIHHACYERKKEIFSKFSSSVDKLEQSGLLATNLNKIKEFHNMIEHCTVGEAATLKYDVLTMIKNVDDLLSQ